MKINRRLAITLVASATLLSGAAIAQQRVFFGVATGGTGGTYYPLGGMLAQLISNKATVDGKKITATAEAAGEKHGVLAPEHGADLPLQSLVHPAGAGEQRHATCADAPFAERVADRLRHRRIAIESEVIE